MQKARAQQEREAPVERQQEQQQPHARSTETSSGRMDSCSHSQRVVM